MRTCIVNVAIGRWFPRGQAALSKSLDEVRYRGGRVFFCDEYPPDCPTHQESPYAFKVRAIQCAAEQGYDLVIWCDSSAKFIKHPDHMFDVIAERGYHFMSQGWFVSQWCWPEENLRKLAVTRAEGTDMRMVAATVYGLDLRDERSKILLAWMEERGKDGSFVGPWRLPDDGKSANDRMKLCGHRHDQTALSVIVNRLGMKIDLPPGLWAYDYGNQPISDETVVLVKGM